MDIHEKAIDDEKRAPDLVEPTDPITTCDFLVQIDHDDDVTLRILDEDGNEVTRECAGDVPGPVGPVTPIRNPESGFLEAEICLCDIGADTELTFEITDSSGVPTIITRSVSLEEECPSCSHHVYAEIDAVVEELRRAVTKRVVEELRAAVKKINETGNRPKPKKAEKVKEEAKPKTTAKSKRASNKKRQRKTK